MISTKKNDKMRLKIKIETLLMSTQRKGSTAEAHQERFFPRRQSLGCYRLEASAAVSNMSVLFSLY